MVFEWWKKGGPKAPAQGDRVLTVTDTVQKSDGMSAGEISGMTVPLDRALAYTAGAVRAGVPIEKLFELAFVSPGASYNLGRIQKPNLLLLHLAALNGAGDESHGLADDPILLGTASLALRAMLGSFDLDRAILSFVQIYNMRSSTVCVQSEVKGDQATLSIRCKCGVHDAGLLLEDTMINWLWTCLSHYLDQALPIFNVTTRDPAHPNLGSRHWVCSARLKLGGAASITFARSWLTMRGRASPSADNTFQCYLRGLQFVEAQDAPVDVAADALQSLAEGEAVSRPRRVRRLCTYYGGYRASREAVIIDGALMLLGETQYSVDAIAVELGYTCARSFRRFFKASVGVTPQEFRRGNQPRVRQDTDGVQILARLKQLTMIFDR